MGNSIANKLIREVQKNAVTIYKQQQHSDSIESGLKSADFNLTVINKLMDEQGIDRQMKTPKSSEFASLAMVKYLTSDRVRMFIDKTNKIINELNKLAQDQQRQIDIKEASREDYQRRLEDILGIMVDREIASGAFNPVEALKKFKDNYNNVCADRDRIKADYQLIVDKCVEICPPNASFVITDLIDSLDKGFNKLHTQEREAISFLKKLQPDLGTPDDAVSLQDYIEYYFRRMQTLLVEQGVINTTLRERLDSANVPTNPSIVTRVDALLNQNRESMKLITEQRMKLKNIEDYIIENNPNDKLRKASDSLLDRLKATVTQVAMKQVEQSEGGYFETRAIIKKHLPDQANLPIAEVLKGLIRDLEAYQMEANFTKDNDHIRITSNYPSYNLYPDKLPNEFCTNVEVLAKTPFAQYITISSEHCEIQEKGYIKLIRCNQIDPDEYEIIGWRYTND